MIKDTKILIADENREIRERMRELLQDKGAKVTTVITDLNNLGCGVGHLPDGIFV